MSKTTKQQLLRKAVLIYSREELAQALKVPGDLLDVWLFGHATIPDRKLLLLADFLEKVNRS